MKKSAQKAITINQFTKIQKSNEEDKKKAKEEKEKIIEEKKKFIEKRRQESLLLKKKNKINIRSPKYASLRKIGGSNIFAKHLSKSYIIKKGYYIEKEKFKNLNFNNENSEKEKRDLAILKEMEKKEKEREKIYNYEKQEKTYENEKKKEYKEYLDRQIKEQFPIKLWKENYNERNFINNNNFETIKYIQSINNNIIQSENELRLKTDIKKYLNTKYILSPISQTNSIKIITSNIKEESTLPVKFPENFGFNTFLLDCAHCFCEYIIPSVPLPISPILTNSNKLKFEDGSN